MPGQVPSQAPLPGLWGPGRAAPVIRKCKMRNTTEKAKTLFGFNPSPHGRHSSCLEALFSQFLEQGCDPGHSGAAGRAAGATSLMGTPSNKLSKCVYIYLYIFISIYLSLSHAALGIEEEQTAKQEVRMGAPVCREQGHPGPRHPKAHSHSALASTRGFFLAYILQQYRNSLPYPEPWRSRSSGTGADPVPAGAAVLAPTALSQPGARGGQPGSGGILGAATIPWLARGIPVSCLASGSLPSGQGEQGDRVPSAIAAPLERCEPMESCSPAEPVSPPTASCCSALGHAALTPGSAATTLLSTGKGQVTWQRCDPLPPRESREERTRALA